MAANQFPELTEKLRANAEARARLAVERDELIREAAAAGMKKTHISEAAALSPVQVHRIIRGETH
jgi:hypothetical protein